MIVNDNLDLIYNLRTLVCLPQEYKNKIETFEYNFKYVYLFECSYDGVDKFITFIKNNNIKEIIFVDYRLEYENIIDNLNENVLFSAIFMPDLASLSSQHFLIQHNGLINLYKKNRIYKLGFLDANLYKITKQQFDKTYYILLDEPITEEKEQVKKKGIGLINISDDPKHSYFNELSAVSMLDEEVNVQLISPDIKRFNSEFEIKANELKLLDLVIKQSELNLYINFCNTDISLFLKSMDMNTICLLGNNSYLTQYKFLQENLQVKSDDDINEIVEKIENARKNKKKIFNEYLKFRKDYSKKSKESINDFLGYCIENEILENSEILLTVGIPVYNVEKYVEASIQSVISSIGDKTEIIIVDDGSTDNSKEIIMKYQKMYPELIKVICQENYGLGNVRNVIMENAKGKYIASIDSDDTINKEFFKEARKYLEKDIDMVLCDWLSIFKENEKYPTEAQDNNFKFDSNYKKLYYSTIMPSNCNKIIKKELYKRMNLKFIEQKFEDFGTNPIIWNKVETIKYINKPYYEYNIRQNSIMRSKVGYSMIDAIRLLEDRVNTHINDDVRFNKKEFVAYVYSWRIEESIINQLYNLEENERNDMIDYIYENIEDVLKNVYENNECTQMFIDRIDEETSKYIIERNKNMLKNKDEFKKFINKKIKDNSYKILTPALILYNYDNRG